jgi:hypothetical protein
MEKLTKQDLAFAAHALRISAAASEKRAETPAFFSSRDIFLRGAREQRELAEKFERIAKRMRE